jgi:hypothetical protein
MAQQAHATNPHAADEVGGMAGMHHHGAHGSEYPAAVSFVQLKDTVAQLERVRQVTAKYRDVRIAEADGYKGTGPEVKGMGVHFMRELEPNAFELTKPPMLCYEKDTSRPGGYALVGVVYLMESPEGSDGQPTNNPFPKPLAVWHNHPNVCALNNPRNKLDHSNRLSEEECKAKGGHFLTEWMIHAWIWKDSPLGVFSPKNPLVAVKGQEGVE